MATTNNAKEHTVTKTYNLSEPAYLWPYTAYVLLMMGEIVARNM